MRVKALEHEDLDAELESDSDESISERLDPESEEEFHERDVKSKQGKSNERLGNEEERKLGKWKGYRYKHRRLKEFEQNDTGDEEEEGKRPGKRVSKKQMKAKKRKKE